MPENERILMEKWCSGNLRGLSQKTPRQRSEKDNPETLPIQAYAVSTPSIVESVCIPEQNACQNISQSHQDLPIELNQSYQLISLKFGLLNITGIHLAQVIQTAGLKER